MKRMTLKNLLAMVTMGLVMFGVLGCSDETVERIENAKNALSGDVEKTPDVVQAQQRKERIRQDKKWTLENQAKYPKEYCQAQLEELAKYAGQLDVQAHKYSVTKNQVTRTIVDCEAQIKAYEAFLKDAKVAYREADTANQWPMSLNGFVLSKAKAQEKIVDAAKKIQEEKALLVQRRNMLVTVEKRLERVYLEQRNVVKIRERVQATLVDLDLKRIIEEDQGVTDALNAINASLKSLETDYDDVPLSTLVSAESTTEDKVLFNEIMAE